MITKEEAANNRHFHYFHKGKCHNYRANGMMKTWKRNPERFRVPLKYGMYEYGYLTEENCSEFHLPGGKDCPTVVK